MEHRGILPVQDRKVWCFLGDGETDEPEAMGAITMPVRERLDNLIFVINCNLQRLDGPVRGNGKIIQELEAAYQGAGWNVIKVIWGSRWDPLLARDHSGALRRVMEECVDGEYQNFKAKDGAYTREHFFGRDPALREMVANMSDRDIWRLNRGGHDAIKVYAAYKRATEHKGRPTVILAKTVKGYGMGGAGEGQNITHQKKKLSVDDIRAFRDRFRIPIADEDFENDQLPYYKPADDSEEMQYLRNARESRGGHFPVRSTKKSNSPAVPPLELFKSQLESSGDREVSTTMAFVRILTSLLRDEAIGQRIVPIVPDEARTFGMEGLFRQVGIYSSVGQLYTPQDSDQLMYYREDKKGQILEEGINEGGSYCSWIAAATSYANNGVQMIPFYIYYSMFGFQRIGDFAWASGDMRARGFLVGGTAGRTTLAGEGLQHQDGHSLLTATTIPNCRAYDPCYAYEMAVIIHDGLRRMCEREEDVFYYITAMNENYAHPAMPEGSEEGILRGMHRVREGEHGKVRVQLFGSGTILREALQAAEILETRFRIPADVWSVTSYSELRREALAVDRWNGLHPGAQARQSFVESTLAGIKGPFIAASDYMKTVADQIRKWVPGRYVVLGTDGFGRSDARAPLRNFFEVDSKAIVAAALNALADEEALDQKTVAEAIADLGIDPEKPDPVTH